VTAAPPTTTPADASAARSIVKAWWGDVPCDLAPLPGSGFSGATLWRVQAPTGRFVLKGLPAGTSPERAAWVHRLMLHLRAAGCSEVPAVVCTAADATLASDRSGRIWELVAFAPGGPTSTPTPAQAIAAMEALARVHVAAAALPGPVPDAGPGLPRRLARVQRLIADPWQARRGRLAPPAAATDLARGMRARLDQAIATFAAVAGDRALAAFARWRPPAVPVQPVLRDVWADHVFFAQDRVTGLIDLHAAGCDTPATDIARLLGSWKSPWPGTGAWATRWGPALDAYHAVRVLSAAERRVLPLIHASTIVLGLDNWFQWVLEEGRSFSAPAALERVDRLLSGLAEACRELAQAGPVIDFEPV